MESYVIYTMEVGGGYSITGPAEAEAEAEAVAAEADSVFYTKP